MTGLQRTHDFLAGRQVDHPPFHPIIMRWAARHAGVKYRDFCLDYRTKTAAMIRCADEFDIDWVTAFCSQIGPKPYREFAFPGEKRLVDHIHKLGAKAKLHICGNTAAIMPDMIATGADIIDVDHLVPDMEAFAGFLSAYQVFSGKTDPVSIIQNGTPEQIAGNVRKCRNEGRGRVIVSAGCEVPPDTSQDNMRALSLAARKARLDTNDS